MRAAFRQSFNRYNHALIPAHKMIVYSFVIISIYNKSTIHLVEREQEVIKCG